MVRLLYRVCVVVFAACCGVKSCACTWEVPLVLFSPGICGDYEVVTGSDTYLCDAIASTSTICLSLPRHLFEMAVKPQVVLALCLSLAVALAVALCASR